MIANNGPKPQRSEPRRGKPLAPIVLGIETSCDETACGLARGAEVLSNVVASQEDLHRRFGGVVPEIASRAHLERLPLVLEEVLARAGIKKPDAVAVTVGPGLLGALLVGTSFAQALAAGWKVPLIPVHHLYAHLWVVAAMAKVPPPFCGLVISGGHTAFYEWPAGPRGSASLPGGSLPSVSRPLFLGGTVDDAAGEAFDKVASLLNLGYPGGPAIEQAAHGIRLAASSRPGLPLAGADMPGLSLSFSGLKTAVLYHLQRMGREPLTSEKAEIAAGFQESVARTLALKTEYMLKMKQTDRAQPLRMVVGGGVAVNMAVRKAVEAVCERLAAEAFFPPPGMAQDNGAMVALYGAHLLGLGEVCGAIANGAKPLAKGGEPLAFVPEPFARGRERMHV